MHQSAPASSEVGFLPAMYSFSGPASLPEFDLGPPSASGHPRRARLSNSWETRCLRKNRRRVDDEGCSAKRRKLMGEDEAEISPDPSASTYLDWSAASGGPPPPTPPSAPKSSPASPRPRPASRDAAPPQASPAPSRSEAESSFMEIEAAQRKLQEIEDRITLEDDDEDLDVEPAPRRPVLVISDSLKEGLQRGISDILPHTVAQSVSHSCMELVLWRPPDDPFCPRRKGSLQKHRRPTAASGPPVTPCPSPSPRSPSSPPVDTRPSPYSFPDVHGTGEEDMEM